MGKCFEKVLPDRQTGTVNHKRNFQMLYPFIYQNRAKVTFKK